MGKRADDSFEETVAENFPDLGKEKNSQVQEAQRALNKDNSQRHQHATVRAARLTEAGTTVRAARLEIKVES